MNGDSRSYEGSEDAGLQNDNLGDITDPSRGESTEQNQDAITGQERASAIKKPVSFKAVSVTKNFLAKSGSGVTAMTKAPVDKGWTIYFRCCSYTGN